MPQPTHYEGVFAGYQRKLNEGPARPWEEYPKAVKLRDGSEVVAANKADEIRIIAEDSSKGGTQLHPAEAKADALAMELAALLDHRRAHLPWPVGEHHHMRAELRRRVDRVLARRHGIDAALEGILRSRPDLDARLLVVRSLAFHEAGPQRLDDHGGGFVEAAARFFQALHRLDQAGLDQILAIPFPDQGLGRALNDRLRRAAHH